MDEELIHGFEKYLTFTLADEVFALSIATVREVLDVTSITRIPQTRRFIRGVVNLRGNAVPVVDLRVKFGMSATETTLNTRIIIMEVDTGTGTTLLGALADSVKEVVELEMEAIEPPPRMGTTVRAEYILGIANMNGNFIMLLEGDKVFSSDELAAVMDAGSDRDEAGSESGEAA